jgi:hypothetical protein
MKTLVHVTAQYFENYNFYDAGEPRWKPKGGQVFSLMVDSDLFFYMKDECVKAIQSLLDEQSNSHSRYEYIDHELIFHGITPLNDDKFVEAFQKECNSEKAQ